MVLRNSEGTRQIDVGRFKLTNTGSRVVFLHSITDSCVWEIPELRLQKTESAFGSISRHGPHLDSISLSRLSEEHDIVLLPRAFSGPMVEGNLRNSFAAALGMTGKVKGTIRPF